MLLVGRHGTTKHVVKSLVLQWQRTQSFRQPFATGSCRLSNESSKSKHTPSAGQDQHEISYGVLGGGVTGLSAAYFLTRKFPDAKVTIYESSKRLGGWVDSELVEVDGGQVLFEWGPRSLRPDLSGPGKITAQLIYELGLTDDIVATHRDHVAARNRFIYYPDHLVRMPAPYAQTGIVTNVFRNLRTLITEPIFKGMIGGILAEPNVSMRPKHVQDESVGDFVQRRFGPTIANNMLSALFHGIYAGDIYKLSARTLLPKLWYLETRDPTGAGVIPELFELTFKNETLYSSSDASLPSHYTKNENSNRFHHDLAQQSVYTFTKGIGQLISQLEQALLQNSNVKIMRDTIVQKMGRDPEPGSITIIDRGEVIGRHDYIISTLDPSQLGTASDLGTQNSPLQVPEEIKDAATVMVVNFYYTDPHLTAPHRGFGYLIPQSIPTTQNPERALGVIFASETSGPRSVHSESNDPVSARWATNHQDTAPGTKLTVMLGGHWWDSWPQSDIPSPSAAIDMAQLLLARHMSISAEPLFAEARLQERAIPQYRPGHRRHMAAVHGELQRFQGRIRVAGPAWQGGVGVNDCIRKAWEVVEDLGGSRQGGPDVHGEDWQRRAEANSTAGNDLWSGGGWKTGLEHYIRDEEWFVLDRKGGAWRKEGGD